MKRENRCILIFENAASAQDALIEKFASIGKKAMRESGKFVIALSGGRTPIMLYRRLARSRKIPAWSKTHIFLVDERFVPFTSANSNYKMVKENLLRKTAVPESNIHPIRIKRTKLLSAQFYEKEIKAFFDIRGAALPRFDLILLGAGKDGHTASLFAASGALRTKRKLAVPVSVDKHKAGRITLTLPVINSAKNIFFLITGSVKAGVTKKILEGNKTLPASRVKAKRGEVLFFLDKSSATHLAQPKSLPGRARSKHKKTILRTCQVR